jgi:hypothetical protein
VLVKLLLCQSAPSKYVIKWAALLAVFIRLPPNPALFVVTTGRAAG